MQGLRHGPLAPPLTKILDVSILTPPLECFPPSSSDLPMPHEEIDRQGLDLIPSPRDITATPGLLFSVGPRPQRSPDLQKEHQTRHLQPVMNRTYVSLQGHRWSGLQLWHKRKSSAVTCDMPTQATRDNYSSTI